MSGREIAMRELAFAGMTAKVIDDRKFDKFYRKLAAGSWEPETFAFLSRYLDKDTVYIDVGSWIGITPTFASARAKKVIAVEPEPFCVAAIEQVISANGLGNVTLVPAALSDAAQLDFYLVGGGGSSKTSLVAEKGAESVRVKGVSVEQLKALAGEAPYVVKIDIEGFEYFADSLLAKFSGAKLRAVQLALHPATLAKSSRWFWPVSRIQAARRTARLVNDLARSLGSYEVRGYRSLGHYLAAGVVFGKKCKGTEVVFSRTSPV